MPCGGAARADGLPDDPVRTCADAPARRAVRDRGRGGLPRLRRRVRDHGGRPDRRLRADRELVHPRDARVSRVSAASVSRRTIEGWEAVVLENERLRVAVLPAKGGDVVELVDLESGADVLFKAPWGLRPPGSPPREGSGDIEFVWNYEGGWQELFPNVNDACTVDGVAVPFHGEAALLPWDVEVLDEEAAVRLTVRLDVLPFRLERVLRLRPDAAELEVEGTATNE